MDRLYDTPITVYANVKDNVGCQCTMRQFLKSRKYRSQIEAIRQCPDELKQKEMKKLLPTATLSGVFSPTRHASNLVKHSGYICIDIDQQDNAHLDTPEQMLNILRNRPEVMYAALSIRGRGYFALIPMAHPDKHRAQFQQLLADYAAIGLKLDDACADVCRLRFVTVDDNPYLNPNAIPYEGLYVEQLPQCFTTAETTYNPNVWSVERKVDLCVKQILHHGIDITDDYNDWLSIGAALSTLGELGRTWFHQVSSINPGYSSTITNKKFDNVARTMKEINIGTFFYLCRQYGINYSNPIE